MDSGTLDAPRITLRHLATIGLMVVALASSWMYFGSTPKADAENFCLGVNLARFGQPGDSCTAPNGGWLYLVVVESTGNAGGCASSINNGVLLGSWVCVGDHQWTEALPNPNNFSHGIIRNNNTTKTGTFNGGQNACPNQGCK